MSSKHRSLTWFINRRITVIYLIVLAISIPLIYYITLAQIANDAERQLEDMVAAIRGVHEASADDSLTSHNKLAVSDAIRRLLESHDRFFHHEIGLSGRSPTGMRFAALDQQLAARFRGDSRLEQVSGRETIGGSEVVYLAYAVRDFPARNLAGISLIGIELHRLQESIVERGVTFIGLMTILYAIIVSSINTTIRNHVINPLLRINNRTRAVAQGAFDKVFETRRNDEIGELIRAIELLRRSLDISMRKLRGNSKGMKPKKTKEAV